MVADQLKLRGGLVRCGVCRRAFDAIGSLSYTDDDPMPAASMSAPTGGAGEDACAGPPTILPARAAPAPTASPPSRAAPVAGPDAPVTAVRAGSAPRAWPAESPAGLAPAGAPIPTPTVRAEDPLLAPPPVPAGQAATPDAWAITAAAPGAAPFTVPGPAADPLPVDEAPGPATRLFPEAESALGRAQSAVAADAGDEPDGPRTRAVDPREGELAPLFLRQSAPARAPRASRWLYGAGTALLGVLLCTQLAVAARGELLTQWPQLREWLQIACQPYRCSANWPTRAEQLAVVGSELQALPGIEALELTAVIRNRAEFTQALPAIELTLTDARNQPLARKVFLPADYLAAEGAGAAARVDQGLAAESDLAVRLVIEARGLPAAGFVLYPFFP